MNWPPNIRIRVLSRDSRLPVENLVLFVTVVTSRKNSYSFGPFLTSKTGEIELLVDDLRRWVAETKNEFPMDYVDDIEQCEGGLLVEVESSLSLEARWQRIRKLFPDRALIMKGLLDGKGNFLPIQVRKAVPISAIQSGTIDV